MKISDCLAAYVLKPGARSYPLAISDAEGHANLNLVPFAVFFVSPQGADGYFSTKTLEEAEAEDRYECVATVFPGGVVHEHELFQNLGTHGQRVA